MILGFIFSFIFVLSFPDLFALEIQEKRNLYLLNFGLIPFFLIGF